MKTKMEREQSSKEALIRATTRQSLTNYPAIIQGFVEKGIPEDEIHPRENVFTLPAWNALGRRVKPGEHGVRVLTYREYDDEDEDGNTVTRSTPSSSTVFHVSQTMEVGTQPPKKGER